MKSRSLTIPAAALAAAAFLTGADPAAGAPKKGHSIAGLEGLDLVETPHYRIYGKDKKLARYRDVLETVWKESEKLLPRIGIMFKTGDLRAEPERDEDGKLVPRGQIRYVPGRTPKAAEEDREPLKMTIIIVDGMQNFRTAGLSLMADVKAPEDRERVEAGLDVSPTCRSLDGCTRLYRKNIPGMQEKEFENFLAHIGAADLMTLNQGGGRAAPFWLTAGFGFYMDFKLFNKSHTLYLDYEKYYSDSEEAAKAAGGKFDKKDTLGVGIKWAPVLRRLMKKGEKGDLKEVLSADTSNLTPPKCGYMYALISYLVKDRQHAAAFAQFLMDFRDADVADPSELLVKNYKSQTIESLQAAWHRFIVSHSFK